MTWEWKQSGTFSSGHGKGPCDGLGATVKYSARQAVLQHLTNIHDAHELFSYCEKDLKKLLQLQIVQSGTKSSHVTEI